jgi:hypothetical protein
VFSRTNWAGISVRDSADGGVVFLDGGAASAAGPAEEAADGNRALGHGVGAAVGTEERGLEEDAALESLGIAHGGDHDVDARAGAHEGADVGREHDGGDVLGLDVLLVDGDAVTREGVLDGAEGGAGVGVALAGETDDEAVADELVVTPALDEGQVLDAGGLQRDGGKHETREREHPGKEGARGGEREASCEIHP